MSRKAADMADRVFGRWTVVARADNSPSGQIRWMCRCVCGTEAIVQSGALKSGHSKSCGCHKVETTIRRSTKHGHATNGISPTYHSWAGMIARCTDPDHKAFPRYGGRGIAVCDRWSEFSLFLADMGEKPKGTSLDRRNNDQGYSPENCRWATPTTQATNKSNTDLRTIEGVTKPHIEWCRMFGMTRSTVDDRVKHGWPYADAVRTPAGTNILNRKSRLLTAGGRTQCVTEWARELGIPKQRIYQRLHRGASDTEALRVEAPTAGSILR